MSHKKDTIRFLQEQKSKQTIYFILLSFLFLLFQYFSFYKCFIFLNGSNKHLHENSLENMYEECWKVAVVFKIKVSI